MEILILIFGAFLLGLIGGSVPGPILTATFTETLRSGFTKGLRVILRALAAEFFIAFSVLAIFFSFNIPQIFFYTISLIGVGVLVWLAAQVWKIKEIGGKEGDIFSFWKIFLLTVFNGPFWIFWITISVPQAFLLREKIAGGHFLFLILFELGWLLSTVLWTSLFSYFRLFLRKNNFVGNIFKILSLLLLFFAIRMAIQSVSFFVNIF